jgi:replicative DNA helicase
VHEITKDKVLYCSNQIEQFCKYSAMESAIINSVDDVRNGDHAKVLTRVQEALMVSLNQNLGLRYFDNPEKRLNEMLNSGSTQPTLWTELDELLFGGICRKELILVSANSGGGKSLTLANLAANFAEQGLNSLYISLELSENIIAQRFDTMFTGISRKEWKERKDEIAVRVTEAAQDKGHIDIKQLPTGTTAIDIEAYLKEYYLHYGYMPDLLIVDYLDCMRPNEKNIDLSDISTKDKLSSEQLRDLMVRYNMFGATASQLNRSAVNATHQSHDQIAGGMTKINTADTYWSIIMSETMKAKNEIAFCLQKTRNSDGVGKTIYLTWDAKYMRIRDRGSNTPNPLPFKKKDKYTLGSDSVLSDVSGGGDELMDLMSSTR